MEAGKENLISRNYVKRIEEKIQKIEKVKVVEVIRKKKIQVKDQNDFVSYFDHVIFATSANEAVKILGKDIRDEEYDILKNFDVSENKAILHNDERVKQFN